MPLIDIDTASARTYAQNLSTIAQEFSRSIDEIYAAKDELSSGWKGEDAEKYKAKLEEFREPLNNLQKSLVAYSEFITGAANAYDQQQQNIASAI